jgi:hypothetical protein
MRNHSSHGHFRKKIEGLDALVNLEELWLGRTKSQDLRYDLSSPYNTVVSKPGCVLRISET